MPDRSLLRYGYCLSIQFQEAVSSSSAHDYYGLGQRWVVGLLTSPSILKASDLASMLPSPWLQLQTTP